MVLQISALTIWIALISPAGWLATEIRFCALGRAELRVAFHGHFLSDFQQEIDARNSIDLLRLILGEAAAKAIESTSAALIGAAAGLLNWPLMVRTKAEERSPVSESTIRSAELGLWGSEQWPLILAGTAIIIQAGLISILVQGRRRRTSAELESRRRLSQLALVHRQAIATQLSSAIAHEINQPLASILTNAETAELILESDDPNLGETKQILADIRHDVLRASQVIVHMRSLLRRAPFELKTVDVNVLVRDTIKLMRPQAAARNVALYLQLCDGPLLVEIDPIQIQQVLINVVVNAMDAMAEMPFGRAVVAKTSAHEQCALVSIADLGPGIPKESMTGLFEPFVTTKEHGMGIGLSIARTIMHAHKGKIWAENQEPGGAIFFLSLPVAK